MKDVYFFRPRIGGNYADGFKGRRTLVVGAYHYCWEEPALRAGCTDYSRCVGNGRCRDYDKTCPFYKDRTDQDYYRLSNSNIIEIDSYIEGERCPSYSGFTKFMTGESDYIPRSDRAAFWESVAFYNYIQHFLHEAVRLDYHNMKEALDRDFSAFEQVLEELVPDVVYVWDPAVNEAIKANLRRMSAGTLVYDGNAGCQTLTVNRYLFYPEGTEVPDRQPRRKTLKWFRNYVRSRIGDKDPGNLPYILYNGDSRYFSVADGQIVPLDGDKCKFYKFIATVRDIPKPASPAKSRFTWPELDRIFGIPNLKMKIRRYKGRQK